jgi:hypothetical protein
MYLQTYMYAPQDWSSVPVQWDAVEDGVQSRCGVWNQRNVRWIAFCVCMVILSFSVMLRARIYVRTYILTR